MSSRRRRAMPSRERENHDNPPSPLFSPRDAREEARCGVVGRSRAGTMSVAASAKMALAFAELTGGVKFDGKKHRDEMSRFSAKKHNGGGGGGSVGSARSGEGASGSGRAGGHDAGDGGGASGSGNKKKKQKDLASRTRERARGVSERADDDAVEVFGTRSQNRRRGGGAPSASASSRKKPTAGESESSDSDDDIVIDSDSETPPSDSLETGLEAALRTASAEPPRSSKIEEAANALRKKHKIRVRDAGGEGRCPPPLSSGFAEIARRYPTMGCGKMLLSRLKEAGFDEPTPIQRQAIPSLLENHELLAVAPTGSGKTLAFLLPIICSLKSKDDEAGGPRALLLSPTKELAQQSHRILRLLCRGVNTLR